MLRFSSYYPIYLTVIYEIAFTRCHKKLGIERIPKVHLLARYNNFPSNLTLRK